MNTLSGMNIGRGQGRKLIAIAVAAVLLAACTTPMTKPAGADSARTKLSQLQADPQLASLAPVAIKDAETAVRAAEVPTKDQRKAAHLVLIADRKIETARALAQARQLEDQRKMLTEQRESVRLEARTREADLARTDANTARTAADSARSATVLAQTEASNARSDANTARSDANVARNEADAAAVDSAVAKQQSDDLQRQILALNAKETERGLVITLGDVLFDTGKATVKSGSANNLSKLAGFLTKYGDRTVLIEGHTDNVGSESSNQGLSERRAESVKAYLIGQGVGSVRISAIGKGEGSPVATNDTDAGRKENRRVEVIIAEKLAVK